MAETQKERPELDVSREYWLDLEIPYNKIRAKWDTEYEARLRRFVVDDRISSYTFQVYFELKDRQPPTDKHIAFNQILDYDPAWGHNLLCQYEFSHQKSPNIVKEVTFQNGVNTHCQDTEYYKPYLSAYEREDKITLIALMQIFQPELLKNVLSLQHCYGKKPRLNTSDPSASEFNLIDAAEAVVEKLSKTDFRQYENWHIFEHNDSTYLMIKRQRADSVERQAGQNLEEEPADFVVMQFEDDTLKIFADTKTIAHQTRTALNESMDVDFDTIDTRIPPDQIEPTIGEVFSFDHDDLEEAHQDVDNVEKFKVTGIKLSSSPFPGHPSLTMKSEAGILDTVEALDERGFDILKNSDDIEVVFTEYQEREFKLLFKETEINGETVNVIRYDARYPGIDEKLEYEQLVRELFGIDAIFESS